MFFTELVSLFSIASDPCNEGLMCLFTQMKAIGAHPYPDIESLSRVIQMAVAPVFLLAGIGSLLGVLSNRLGRITDRARVLENLYLEARAAEDDTESLQKKLARLWHRVRIINLAITLCTLCALLICIVIVMMFVGDFAFINISTAIAVVFIIAMLILILGLLSFLREVSLATTGMREDIEYSSGSSISRLKKRLFKK